MPDGLVLVRVPKTIGTQTRTQKRALFPSYFLVPSPPTGGAQNKLALSGFRVTSSHLTWELKDEVAEGGEEGTAQ